MRSGSRSSRYFPAASCAFLSGPPLRRTWSSGTGRARMRSLRGAAGGDPISASAEEPSGPSETAAAAARRPGPIKLDARLDEDAWKAATPITEFTQLDPEEGKPASQRTEVRFVFDDDALYIGAKMYDTAGGAGVMTRLVRRDASFDS